MHEVGHSIKQKFPKAIFCWFHAFTLLRRGGFLAWKMLQPLLRIPFCPVTRQFVPVVSSTGSLLLQVGNGRAGNPSAKVGLTCPLATGSSFVVAPAFRRLHFRKRKTILISTGGVSSFFSPSVSFVETHRVSYLYSRSAMPPLRNVVYVKHSLVNFNSQRPGIWTWSSPFSI